MKYQAKNFSKAITKRKFHLKQLNEFYQEHQCYVRKWHPWMLWDILFNSTTHAEGQISNVMTSFSSIPTVTFNLFLTRSADQNKQNNFVEAYRSYIILIL